MPPKNETSGQFFYEVDREMKPIEIGQIDLNDIPNFEIYEPNIENEKPKHIDFYGTIHFRLSRKSRRKLMKALLYGNVPIYITNNWRKRHGLPMSRRNKAK